MLDRDLARLYGVETGQLNRQVKRGYKRRLKPPCNHAFIFSISNKERTPCFFIPHSLSQNRDLIPSSHRSKDRLWRICPSPEIHHITQAALIQLLTGEILR